MALCPVVEMAGQVMEVAMVATATEIATVDETVVEGVEGQVAVDVVYALMVLVPLHPLSLTQVLADRVTIHGVFVDLLHQIHRHHRVLLLEVAVCEVS